MTQDITAIRQNELNDRLPSSLTQIGKFGLRLPCSQVRTGSTMCCIKEA